MTFSYKFIAKHQYLIFDQIWDTCFWHQAHKLSQNRLVRIHWKYVEVDVPLDGHACLKAMCFYWLSQPVERLVCRSNVPLAPAWTRKIQDRETVWAKMNHAEGTNVWAINWEVFIVGWNLQFYCCLNVFINVYVPTCKMPNFWTIEYRWSLFSSGTTKIVKHTPGDGRCTAECRRCLLWARLFPRFYSHDI